MSEAPRDQPPRDEETPGERPPPPGFEWEGEGAPRGATPADRAGDSSSDFSGNAVPPRAADGGDLPPAPPPLPAPGSADGPDATQVVAAPPPSQDATAAYPPAPYGGAPAAPYPPAPYPAPPAYEGQGYTAQGYPAQGYPAQGYGAPGYGYAPQGYGPPPGYAAPPPMSPEAEDVRGKAVLWTVLNGIAIFLCGNVGAIVGVILAAMAIGRSRTDVAGARRLVRWSWIWFIIGFVVGFLFWTVYLIAAIAIGVFAG